MMPRREKPHPDSLLCERCGYRLEGLEPELPCPECGTPIAESLPERRVGSEWQRRPGFIAWLKTNWGTLRHPWTRWDEVRAQPTSGLLFVNCACAAATAILSLTLAPILRNPGDPSNLFGLIAGTILLTIAFVVLTQVEGLGLRVLGTRNKWRTTKEISRAIIAHASIGWLLAAPVLMVEMVVLNTGGPNALGRWIVGSPWGWPLMVAAPPLAGLVGFELLAWLGWRKMKFANRPPRNPIEGV